MIPVFIGGHGRSGTTMLASMLGAAKGAVVTPESQFKTEIGSSLPGNEPFDARRALAAIESHWRFKIWEYPVSEADRGDLLAAPDWPAFVETLAQRYAMACGVDSPRLWIDHTPANIMDVPTLAMWFPEARFVHIIRDGRALYASTKRLDWGHGDIALTARWWSFVLAHGLAAENFLQPGRISRVHYEHLVTEPEATMRRLCHDLGLDYTPAMLRGDAFAVPGYTRDQHVKVGRPPDPRQAEAWRQQLSPREVEIYEAAGGQLLRMLGYDTFFGLTPEPARPFERLRFLWGEIKARTGLRRRWRQARVSWGRRARRHGA